MRPGAQTLFQAGSPAFIYWPGVVVFIGASLALAGLIVRALQTEAWGGAAFIAAFLALFLWQAGTFFPPQPAGDSSTLRTLCRCPVLTRAA